MAQSHAIKMFYGWWVVLASATGLAVHFGPILAVTFGVFFIPLQETFGWSRSEISLAFALATLGLSLAQPIAGISVDRYGARRVIMPAAVLFGLGVMSFYLLSAALWHLYLLYFLLGVVGTGTTPVPFAKVISQWFDRRRGLALALTIAGSSVGTVIMPPLAQALISSIGWRQAYVVLGVIVIAVTIPVIGLFLRENPESMGLRPDGDEPSERDHTAAPAAAMGLTRVEALRTTTFWLLVVTFLSLSIAFHACLIHLVPMLRDQGMSAEAAAGATSLLAIGILVGRVGTGVLLDRYFAPYIGLVFFFGFGIALVFLWLGSSLALMLLAAVLLGLAQGAEFDLMAYLISRYFGLKQFAEIYSFVFSAFTLGGAIGPPLMGFAFEATGSYRLPLGLLIALPLVAMACMTRLGPYLASPASEATTSS